MALLYTKEKRIRKEFGHLPNILDVPNLLEIQINSYENFLQKQIKSTKRKNIGLEYTFKSIFPILSASGYSEIHYIKYKLDKPIFNIHECHIRGSTYAAQLKVTFKIIIHENELDIKEQNIKQEIIKEVYMGEIPLITYNGSFIINGTERVVVSQLHRSPGVFFDHDKGKTHSSGKILHSARIIPYRGSWLDFEFDPKDLIYTRIDRKRKLLCTILLKALGCSNTEILNIFYDSIKIDLIDSEIKIRSNLDELLGSRSPCNIKNTQNEIILNKDKIITSKVINTVKTQNISISELSYKYVINKRLYNKIVTKNTKKIIAEANEIITPQLLETLKENKITSFEILKSNNLDRGTYIANTLEHDTCTTKDSALAEIYKIIRPGEPPSKESSKNLFKNLFFIKERYDLSEVGRIKFNRRIYNDTNNSKITQSKILNKNDIIDVIKELIKIKDKKGNTDDIDHLGNRRIRAVGEMVENQFRIGLIRIEKTLKEKLSIIDREKIIPKDFINAKPITASIKEFFCSGSLSQFMDQANPLSEITHKRRISALGPGGLSRDRAGFEVRDVHPTHYGRLCPVETPEGPNIGLINSLACYTRINKYGFLEAPYSKIKKGIITNKIEYLSATEEEKYIIAQASTNIDKHGKLTDKLIQCRHGSETILTTSDKIQYIDISSKQMVSVAASLIPFLEHDDANRALMGSNMQRQAVPALKAEKPLIGTGMEKIVAKDSGTCIVAKNSGKINFIDGSKIIVDIKIKNVKENNKIIDIYDLTKFKKSNKNTCINQKPIVKIGDYIKKGDILADGSSTDMGELALGQNLLVAFMPWNGFNFEDSILLSEKVVEEDRYTSIYIEELTCIARDTKLGEEEITSDIPNVNENALNKLDETGIIHIGANVKPGDILVAKITPKAEQQLTPEEKLLRAIFGDKASDIKDTSLRVPSDMFATVIDIQIFTREGIKKDDKMIKIEKNEIKSIQNKLHKEYMIIKNAIKKYIKQIIIGNKLTNSIFNINKDEIINKDHIETLSYKELLKLKIQKKEIKTTIDIAKKQLENLENKINNTIKNKKKNVIQGDDLSPGVLKIVKIFLAVKRIIQSGDKIAGRHGNKGVISRILPIEDMPYLENGQPIDIVLNPLGVPSRMNIGQILETHMGLISKSLGNMISNVLDDKTKTINDITNVLDKTYNTVGRKKINFAKYTKEQILEIANNAKIGVPISTPVFDGAKEEDITKLLKLCKIDKSGQIKLFDGRTGKPFDRKITVGYMYMLKLDHLIDDKMHARSTGSYSLVTQQPLGGKSQFGGQRFGEMEVWALQAYGAAYTLREMLTVKSDDVRGRTRIYKNIIDGNLKMDANIPESFNVLMKEIRALGIDIQLESESESE